MPARGTLAGLGPAETNLFRAAALSSRGTLPFLRLNCRWDTTQSIVFVLVNLSVHYNEMRRVLKKKARFFPGLF